MKRVKRLVLLILSGVAVFVFTVLSVSAIVYSPEYMMRIMLYRESDIKDYLVFDAKPIKKSEETYFYKRTNNSALGTELITYQANGKPVQKELEGLLEENETTAFIVVTEDELIYENYFNGHERDSINTSFSAAKSIVSLLIGIAIDEGYIKSSNESISNYIEEFQGTEFAAITIEDLLTMRSPIKYREGMAWIGDDAKTYYMPNLRRLALLHTEVDSTRGENFHYNNYHPLLLGIILERSTGVSVSEFMEIKLWSKLGTEFGATWSIDSQESYFEKMESGINARAIDFAKIGSLVLHNGTWNGQEINSKEWLSKSISKEKISSEDYIGSFLEGKGTQYGYMWYSVKNDEEDIDVYAIGKFGQIIYISPRFNTVIVRHGSGTGEVEWWPNVLRQITEKLNQ
ncbi:serine hydrolase domain-containing protein [Alkalihalobacterium elongatum]|uniref:serine hydrolase domain-containing protein n=1 Tax=Alkalihalobacterium elongatum TaxID=2675466 RepID=UPI001C1F74EC|nr:serine hydrolase [Alkalihalobacterium elongatum]